MNPLTDARPALIGAIGVIISMSAVAAQPSREYVEEIIVVGVPMRVTHEPRPDNPVLRTETVELNRQVSFADLDLSKPADALELRQRVEATAKQSCEMLREMFPLPPKNQSKVHQCVEQAMVDAEDRIQAAIASATQ